MFQAGVPEHIIQQWTGHKCVKVVRLYQRQSEEQQVAVAKVLDYGNDFSACLRASTKEHIPVQSKENQEDSLELEESLRLNFKFVNWNIAIHVGKQ